MPRNTNATPMEAKPEPPNFRIRFVWLVAAHVVIGVVAGLIALMDHPSEWRFYFLDGLMLGQISLLGIWACLGRTVLWKRIIGVLTGVGYLTCLTGLAEGWIDVSFPIIWLFPIASMTFVMLIVRFMTGAIYHERSHSIAVRNHQFSIRHLFVLMSVTACVAAILKPPQLIVGAPFREELILTFLSGIVYAVIAVIPLRSILASNRPVLYGIFVVAVEAYFAFVLGYLSDPFSNDDVLALTFAATQAMCVVITLLIVRSWGYRLMPMG